jgi:predicted O-methyltransferase YrrM
MIQLSELCSEQIGPCGFEFVRDGNVNSNLKLKTKAFPWSIVQREFDYLYNIIVDNNLKRGFEACTGVGISALAAGLAMKQTSGKIVTLDAYIEEYLENPDYHGQKILNIDSLAFQTVQALIAKYQLENILVPVVGWTPDNVPANIEANFTEPLDYVFIDGGHTPSQLLQDINVVLPYTNKDTYWLFHDAADNVFNYQVAEFVFRTIGKSRVIVCPVSEGCNDLAILR